MKAIYFFLLFQIFFIMGTVYAKPKELCRGIFIQDGKLKINNNEKILVCGSSSDASEAWDEVPLRQAQFHLTTILQHLGYLSPRFEIADNQLRVWMGHRTKTKRIQVNGAETVLDPDKKRKIVGEPLMPSKLNEVEAWANIETQSRGYACVENEVVAQAWDGTVLVNSKMGVRKEVGLVDTGELSGLDEDVLDRYQPFKTGDWYDIRKTELMTQRMLADGLFQSAYFTDKCEDNKVHLKLETSIGKPRILRVEIGGSTEEFPFMYVTFKNARLDDKASNYTASLRLSPIETSLEGTSELYIIPGWNQLFLGPRFRVAKEIERAYELNTAKAGVDLGRKWDMWDQRWQARWGPTLNYSKTVRGVGPEDITYPTFEGSLIVMSHIYEYLIREQHEGWMGQFYYRGQNRGLGSQVDVNRYRLDGKHLWNLGGYSPPLFVLGTRIETIIVDADRVTRDEDRDRLPIEDRIWMGGDENLRGFPRESLDNDRLGYLTSLYLGLELRLVEELPFRIQPFLLWDWAKLGNKRYDFDKPIFISEGAGVRWASPFGTIRGSAAKGRIWNEDATTVDYPEEWVFFFSFGQEF